MNFLWTGLLAGLGGAALALLGTFVTAWPKLPQQVSQETSQPRLGQLVAFRSNSITLSPQPLSRALEAVPDPALSVNGTSSDERVVH